MTVRSNYVQIDTHDVLFRHVRIRPGVFNGVDLDAITIYTEASNETTNIFVDHASLTWATDENFGLGGGVGNPDNIDLQYSIAAEPLDDAIPCETTEACANVLVYPLRTNVSLIGNLMADAYARCPNIYAGAEVYMANNVISYCENTTFIGDAHGFNDVIKVTAIGNYYRRPACFGGSCYAIAVAGNGAPAGSLVYHTDTVLVGGWAGVYHVFVGSDPLTGTPPMTMTGYTPLAGSATLSYVSAHVGAYPAFRDSVDTRIISDANNDTAVRIDDPADVGGFPSLATNTIDHSAGTHPRPASPHTDSNLNGYTNLEDWLQSYACEVEGLAGCWPSGTIPTRVRFRFVSLELIAPFAFGLFWVARRRAV